MQLALLQLVLPPEEFRGPLHLLIKGAARDQSYLDQPWCLVSVSSTSETSLYREEHNLLLLFCCFVVLLFCCFVVVFRFCCLYDRFEVLCLVRCQVMIQFREENLTFPIFLSKI